MRMYDLKSGKRFDKNHPMWPKKKDGSLYERPPKKAIDELGLQLVPSVTEVLAPAKGHKLVGWAFWKASQLAAEFIQTSPDFSSAEDLQEKALAFIESERNKPADDGSDVHEVLDGFIKTGTSGEKELLMCESVRKIVLDELGVDILRDIESEVPFAISVIGMCFGGTRDAYKAGRCVLDFKTTDGQREPYISECAQLVAYNDLDVESDNYCPLLANVYIDRKTMLPYLVKKWSYEERLNGYDVFVSCYELLKALGEI